MTREQAITVFTETAREFAEAGDMEAVDVAVDAAMRLRNLVRGRRPIRPDTPVEMVVTRP